MISLNEAEDALKSAYLMAIAESLKVDKNPICEKVVYRGNKPYKTKEPKIGRNDPCSCGSGKKYKKCCGR